MVGGCAARIRRGTAPHAAFTAGLRSLGRCQQAREILDRDGLTTGTEAGGLKAHPCIGVERDARLAFARLLRELDLDAGPNLDRARPPAIRSNR